MSSLDIKIIGLRSRSQDTTTILAYYSVQGGLSRQVTKPNVAHLVAEQKACHF